MTFNFGSAGYGYAGSLDFASAPNLGAGVALAQGGPAAPLGDAGQAPALPGDPLGGLLPPGLGPILPSFPVHADAGNRLPPCPMCLPSRFTPTAGTLMNGVAAGWELIQLHAAAQAWNKTSPPWKWDAFGWRNGNECFSQAIKLQDVVNGRNPHYWRAGTEGGAGTVLHHHVTLLIPKGGNPLGPVIFDAFKQLGQFSTEVKVESPAEFRKEYPFDCGCCKNHIIPPAARPSDDSIYWPGNWIPIY
jgi:hypothetical protein